jgi:aminocarboxymuconate-semialdehyde decarboxylase
MNIDVHCHVIPEDCLNLHGRAPDGRERGIRVERGAEGAAAAFFDGRELNNCRPEQLYDIDLRLKEMNASGVDVQAVSVVPFLYFYELDATTGAGFARRLNDGIAAVARAHPDRFVALATVPLQAPDLAVEELTRAHEALGMRGVEISSHVAGRNLDEPELEPFFARVEALRMPVFIHPNAPAAADRLSRYYLGNLIGNPLDTSIAAASLIFGGVLHRHPGLTIYLAHGGGNVPYICGRWEHGWHVRPEPKQHLPIPPMEYVRRFYFDSIAHSRPALDYLIRTFGADRVMLGTDYPFDMGDDHPVQTVEALGLDETHREQILGGTAARLFGITRRS